MFDKTIYRRSFLHAEEAAFLLGITKKTLYNWKNIGKIKATNLGSSYRGRLRVPIEEVERIIGCKLTPLEEKKNVD